ncbi:hypothetical protein DESUT3_40490 [Desulfuromonas versatilis]|uniref:UspA domain-containing protein n=1 Tax=Desulfuromonas versatilis TaxID=2802975 RepID=A0ABM8HY68_9BACT|nr:universal stress protein [Desulfuromonas versatilis]BCR06980.1 hypothetical protein DESUT3_40490 [Desulfuromonas versatilis]
MKKALIAVDGSPNAQRAVEYAAQILPRLEECEAYLLALAPSIAEQSDELDPAVAEPELHGDEDHRGEFERLSTALEASAGLLVSAGVRPERISSKVLGLRISKAQDIVDEARAQGCDTIILGRRGQSRLRALLLGSVSAEVVTKAAGLSVWVVE